MNILCLKINLRKSLPNFPIEFQTMANEHIIG